MMKNKRYLLVFLAAVFLGAVGTHPMQVYELVVGQTGFFTADSEGNVTIDGDATITGTLTMDLEQMSDVDDSGRSTADALIWDSGSGNHIYEAVFRKSEMDSSAEFATQCTDETGSGALVFGTSPTIATPTLTLQDGNGAAPTTNGQIKYDRTTELLQVGDGTNTQQFYPGPRWQTLSFHAAAGAPDPALSPCAAMTYAVNQDEVFGLAFDPDTDEQAFWNFAIPADFPASFSAGDVFVLITWSVDDTATDDVIWDITVCFSQNNVAFTTTALSVSGISSTSVGQQKTTVARGNLSKGTIADSLDMTGAANPDGRADPGLMVLQLNRDANNESDDLAYDAVVTSVAIVYKGK